MERRTRLANTSSTTGWEMAAVDVGLVFGCLPLFLDDFLTEAILSLDLDEIQGAHFPKFLHIPRDLESPKLGKSIHNGAAQPLVYLLSLAASLPTTTILSSSPPP